jgi:hypothetical protein
MSIAWLPAIPISSRVEFPGLYEARAILIWIKSPLTSVWRKAGYLRIEELFEGEFLTVSYQAIDFGKSRITIPSVSYRLSFEPVKDLSIIYPNSSIAIYPLTLIEAQTIMPNYAPMPTSLTDQPVLDSLPTSFVAPAYTVAALPAVYQCLPANAARQTFAVSNIGTAPVFLDLDAPSSAVKRFVAIAVGGVYVCDFPYVGAVFIWSSNAVTQNCEIREFIQ